MIFTPEMHLYGYGRRTQHTYPFRELRVTHDVAALAVELTDMAAADHRSSVGANSDDPAEQLAWRRLTARHGDRLGEIMDEYGWPTAALVGEEAARAAWLIAQHADRQLDVQRRALQLMQQAVSAGAVEAGVNWLFCATARWSMRAASRSTAPRSPV